MRLLRNAILIFLLVDVGTLGASEVKLEASDAGNSTVFGWSVSVQGDTALVGAQAHNSLVGAAYLFDRNLGGAESWGQIVKLVASDGAAGDRFGYSVSVDGDTAIAGARADNGGLGAAYVFGRDVGGTDNWGQVKKLVALDGAGDNIDTFGDSVSVDGDTAIVGSRFADHAANASGAAHVFSRNQGGLDNWGEVVRLLPSDATGADDNLQFGISVSVDGDTALVGAHFHDGVPDKSGAAYVFARNEGGADNWGEVIQLTASDAAADDQFGFSVWVEGDTAIVGAFRDESSTGAAYVFSRNEGGTDNWGEVAKLLASDGKSGDDFGYSVSLSGDTAVVGASGADGGPNNTSPPSGSGAAYVFSRNEGGAENWGEVAALRISDSGGDGFGTSVSIDGVTALVGAPNEDGLESNTGAAYLLHGSPVPVDLQRFSVE